MTRIDNDIFELPQRIRLTPIHPGHTIADELAARNLTAHRAALKMRVPPNRLALIINGCRGITADTALRLARLLGSSAQFWMDLQTQYDLAVTERDHGNQIVTEVETA